MFTEDLSVFFQTGDFAVAATYDGSTTVNGLFDAAYVDALGVSSVNPVFMCDAADVPAAGVNKTLLVNGVTYRIRDRQPEGDGALVVLQLEKQ